MGKDKKEKKDVVEEAAPAEPMDDEAEAEETAEERAARKAAKKERKEEKRRRKEEKRAAAEAAAAAETGATPAGGSDETATEEKAAKKRKRQEEAASNSSSSAAATATVSQPGSTINGLRKHFYSQSPAVAAMTAEQIAAFRKERVITVEDPYTSETWPPIAEFANAGSNFNTKIMSLTTKFKQPSPVQAQCWPIQLSGRDVVGIAATGSGKTLAFLLPAFVHIGAQKPLSNAPGQAGPVCLVLAPTRELAMQTAAVASEGGAAVGLKSVCIYGGVPKDEQRKALRNNGGVHVVVATPGRLLDLIQEGSMSLSRVTYLVLDEADR